MVAGKTGRHTFVNWDQVLTQECAHHPALNPYAMPQNAGTRRDLADGFGAVSLDILKRTAMIPMDPEHGEDDLEALAHNIRLAASEIHAGALGPGEAYRTRTAPDLQKFDAPSGDQEMPATPVARGLGETEPDWTTARTVQLHTGGIIP